MMAERFSSFSLCFLFASSLVSGLPFSLFLFSVLLVALFLPFCLCLLLSPGILLYFFFLIFVCLLLSLLIYFWFSTSPLSFFFSVRGLSLAFIRPKNAMRW